MKEKLKNIFKFDFKELIRFGKGRLAMAIYGNATAFIIVDIFNFKYWQYMIVFLPINFIIAYLINKRVFNGLKKSKTI